MARGYDGSGIMKKECEANKKYGEAILRSLEYQSKHPFNKGDGKKLMKIINKIWGTDGK